MNTATKDNLEQELQFFIDHQDELVSKYNGKILALKNQAVVGVFDDYLDAYEETKKEHEPGTFMIQRCIPGKKAYTVTITTFNFAFA